MMSRHAVIGKFREKAYWINVVSSYLPFFIQVFGALFFTPFFIRELGQEQYGLFILINTIIGYFSLCDIGFSQAFTYKVIALLQERNKVKIDSLISSVFFYYLLIGIVINVAVVAGVYFNLGMARFENATYNLFKIGLITLSISFLTILVSQIFDRLLFAKNQIYKINIIKTLQQLAIILLNITVLILTKDLVFIFFNYLIVNLITCLVLYAISKNEHHYTLRLSFISKEAFQSISKAGWWFFVAILNYLLLFQTDVFIITSMFDLKAVALYTIYYKFITLFNTMLTKPTESLIPHITQTYTNKEYHIILRNHKYMLAFIALVAFAITFILLNPGYLLLQSWIGADVVDDYHLFIPFVIYFVLFSIDNVSSTFLSAMCLHKNSVLMGLFNGVLNLVLSIYFCTIMGLAGVIWGSIAALLLSSFWYNLIYLRASLKKESKFTVKI